MICIKTYKAVFIFKEAVPFNSIARLGWTKSGLTVTAGRTLNLKLRCKNDIIMTKKNYSKIFVIQFNI